MTWLTSKVQAGDVPVLLKLGGGAKLNDYVQTVYRKARGSGRGQVAAEIPKGAGHYDWEARKLIGMGLKLGGKNMFSPTGRAVFKGLNVFPGRLRGEPLGFWDGKSSPLEIRTYKYDELLSNDRLFVARELAQLPTIAPVPDNVVFNNTVNLIQLRERFPLNGWVLSRPVMFAAATCLRSTIIEDLGCHWYPKNLGLLPMPTAITEGLKEELQILTEALIEKDDNLADRWRHVEALLARVASSQSVSQLIALGSELVEGLVLPIHEADDMLPDEIEIVDTGLRGDGGAFELHVPNPELRSVLWYMIDRKRLKDNSEVPVSYIGNCPIPNEISPVAAAIDEAYESSATAEFEEARRNIDQIASRALGISDEELVYICERFEMDPFLSRIQPMWAHRGLHVQGYQDHSGGDRFAN